MRGNIAPHDIIYYHLIASARKILFSLFHPGTCRPPSASCWPYHLIASAYDLRTHSETPPRLPCPTAPAPMARGQPRHQSPERRHAMRMALPPPIRLPRPVPAVAAALLPLRCAQIGPRLRGHVYITCLKCKAVAGSNVFFGAEPGGEVGRARAGRVGPFTLRIASPGHRMRLRPRWLSNVGNVAATWHGAPLRACEGTAGTLARCLRSWIGCGYTAPSPPAKPMRCRLAGVSKPRSRFWYASLTAPRNDSPPPILRPLRRSLSARGFATCRPGSSCHLLRRVAHVR